MADRPIPDPTLADAAASVSMPKAARRSPRPAARKPKVTPVPPTVPLAVVRPTPPSPVVAARPQPPKLLPAGHHGPDSTMMYFLSLMLLVIIFFSTLVVVQQVLLVEAKGRLLRLAQMTGGSAAQWQGEVTSLRQELAAANAALAQAQSAGDDTAKDPDGAFSLPVPAAWFSVLDLDGSISGLATPASEAVYRIALGPGPMPTLGGSLPVVVAKIKPASAAKYKAYLASPTVETLSMANTDASVKVTGEGGRRLVVVQRGDDFYAIRYQLANDADKTLEQIALGISFSVR